MGLKELIEQAKHYLFARQTAYQVVFRGPQAEEVLADLAKFCRANDSTFHPDPRMAAQLDGRREVWLRIQHHLKLDSPTLWKLYGARNDRSEQ